MWLVSIPVSVNNLLAILEKLQKEHRLLYHSLCTDVAEGKGFDLRCGGGHLGLQGAPGALPSALGFESLFYETQTAHLVR